MVSMAAKQKTRFTRGDVVELPKRLGGGTGVVVYSGHTSRGELSVVARIVNGEQCDTVVPEDELYRLGRREDLA